ncbi:MAG: hypothetical protein HN704_05000 [Bacteroidetes bacterium]|jgi:hypothetical protein|nr:hypothetical protein [Bacteroidota bacterium]MBT6685770.1 hypothetical protein [Bacteroidota bacterium]MBT7141755.1 hypothetical protein [Bacteroidota bacterium]MBT7490950.1 hypothetical protein [Bacteroidota bacterium]
MTKFISILGFLLVVTSLTFAQKKCKLEKNEIDPMSEQKYLLSKNLATSVSKDYWEGTYFLSTSIEFSNNEFLVLPKLKLPGILPDNRINNCKIEVKLENGQLISVSTEELFNSEFKAGSVSTINFKFQFSRNEIESLSKSEIKAIKLYYNTFDVTFPIAKKRAKKFNQQISCILLESM